jgi:hypothetical protein
MLQKKLLEFFQSNPEATVVFVALGKLFTDFDAAQQFLAGVHGHTVQTVTKEQVIKPEPTINNSGASGETDQQSNDNTNASEGTEAATNEVSTSPSELNKNETGQNTDPEIVSDPKAANKKGGKK